MGKYTGFNVFLRHALKYGFSLFGLPKTGQTTNYYPEDDGEYQKGYPRQGPRFTDNGDGTITDNATGLMWVKDADGAGCNNGVVLAWAAALIFVQDLTFAGYSDWRLPNVKELQSIVDYGAALPAIDSSFTNTQSDNFWSSTTDASFSTFAWLVYFGEGAVFSDDKTLTAYMRPVRGGQ